MVELAVPRVEAQGGADPLARDCDVRRRRRRAKRLSSARQVAVPEGRDLAHRCQQRGPDAGGRFQQARLLLYERGWVPSAGGGQIIFGSATGSARFGRFAAIAVAFHLTTRGEGQAVPACGCQSPLSDAAGEPLDEQLGHGVGYGALRRFGLCVEWAATSQTEARASDADPGESANRETLGATKAGGAAGR